MKLYRQFLTFPNVFRLKKPRGGDSDDEEDSGRGRSRKRKGGKAVVKEDGLSAKQRGKIRSKAMISSSEGSDSGGEKERMDE